MPWLTTSTPHSPHTQTFHSTLHPSRHSTSTRHPSRHSTYNPLPLALHLHPSTGTLSPPLTPPGTLSPSPPRSGTPHPLPYRLGTLSLPLPLQALYFHLLPSRHSISATPPPLQGLYLHPHPSRHYTSFPTSPGTPSPPLTPQNVSYIEGEFHKHNQNNTVTQNNFRKTSLPSRPTFLKHFRPCCISRMISE